MPTKNIRHPWLLLLALLGVGLVAGLMWSPHRSDTKAVQLADWKRIAPGGSIAKGTIWRNPEGLEISGEPESNSGLVIKRYPDNACQYTYAVGERPVFLLSFGFPGVLYDTSYMDDAKGDLILSARYIHGGAGDLSTSQGKTPVVYIEDLQPPKNGAKVSTHSTYYPDTHEVLVQELRNGLPWNGFFPTPTTPHWRADSYTNGVAMALGKDLSDADLAQLQRRYRQQADRDYDANVKNTVQLRVQEIQSALKTSQPLTADCQID
jgi:hypothetical protein